MEEIMKPIIELHPESDDVIALRDMILDKLRERGLYSSRLLYRGFNSECRSAVEQFGSENEHEAFIYALPQVYLDIESDPSWINPLTYALNYGAVAVYHEDRFREVCFTCYEFLDMHAKPDALVAIFLFN